VSADTEPAVAAANGATEPAGEEGGWRVDKQGRSFIAARGRSGIIYRKGNETVEEALARDAKGPRDTPPRKKGPATPRKPPAPSAPSLKDLEYALAEGLRSPAMFCAMAGEEWAANHFTVQGPVLARNLVKAAEHNPWLRAKLEAAVMGEDIMVKVITMMGVGGALAAYAVPPLVYFLNPPFVSEKTREMFGVPDRRAKEPDAPAPPPAPAASPAGAPG
jgi:hypothetical protein